MSATWYPQSALEGFGRSVTTLLGVDVVFGTGQPRTDGYTVYLAPIAGALTDSQFRATCGIALHEAAHVAIGSVPHHQRYSRKGGTQLHASCFNAVIDVADETRLERHIRYAGSLFQDANSDSFGRAVKSGAFAGSDRVWAMLALGIFANRLGWSAVKPHIPAGDYDTALRVTRVLMKARTSRRAFKALGRPRPQYGRLFGLADELVAILRAAGMEQTQQPQPQPFGAIGTDPSMPELGGSAPAPAGAQMADEQTGANLIQSADGRSAGGSANPQDSQQAAMNGALHAAIRPALSGAIDRLARSIEAQAADDGHYSGRGISRHIERACIDGRCFERRNDGDGELLNVAILLDTSGSMRHAMPDVSAIAQAFADAMAGTANSLHLAEFNSATRPVQNFRNAYASGGTGTADALKWARERLAGQRGRRVIVCITDGVPNVPSATVEACGACAASGIDVIGVAYGCHPGSIAASMPRARIIAANGPPELTCGMMRVAGMIAA